MRLRYTRRAGTAGHGRLAPANRLYLPSILAFVASPASSTRYCLRANETSPSWQPSWHAPSQQHRRGVRGTSEPPGQQERTTVPLNGHSSGRHGRDQSSTAARPPSPISLVLPRSAIGPKSGSGHCSKATQSQPRRASSTHHGFNNVSKIRLDKIGKIANLRGSKLFLHYLKIRSATSKGIERAEQASRFHGQPPGQKGFLPMMRLVLVIVATTALSGCQHKGQQAIDPFWGRTTVPSPATGSISAPIIRPGCEQPLQPQPIITQGIPLPNSGTQPAMQPNLLPAPISSTPSTPGIVAPMPAMPGSGGSGVPYGYGAPPLTSPPLTSPPSDKPTQGIAPPSGYSNPGLSPPATMPGSVPADRYPVSPMTPGSYTPSTGGAVPMGSGLGPSVPAVPAPLSPPAVLPPASSPPASATPGLFPPGGYNYDNRP